MRVILGTAVLCTALAGGARADQASTAAVARGEALAIAADCAGCHTADPAKPFAGGKRIATPFGAIYSPNLTPDRQSGIGGYRMSRRSGIRFADKDMRKLESTALSGHIGSLGDPI